MSILCRIVLHQFMRRLNLCGYCVVVYRAVNNRVFFVEASATVRPLDYEEHDDYQCPTTTHFLCTDYSACIPREWLCDHAHDCIDMSDESYLVGCPGNFNKTCSYLQLCQKKTCMVISLISRKILRMSVFNS
jgi:Low-density lipoprotein receptor domain class A